MLCGRKCEGQVIERPYTDSTGLELIAQVIKMEAGDFMLVNDAAEAFGVSPITIRRHIQERGMSVQSVNEHQLAELKRLGAVALKAPSVNILSDEHIDDLIKIINTPEAWAAYRAIFGVGERGQAAAGGCEWLAAAALAGELCMSFGN